MFFYFSEQEERRRRIRGNYIAEEDFKLSNYGYRWKRSSVPSYVGYDTG